MTARPHLSVVANDTAPEPPYPAEVRAKGWKFTLDVERIQQSDTWALAPPDMRPWLLMLWAVSWQQSPVGSFVNEGRLIAARIGMPERMFAASREILMRGWRLHSDGRLYHPTITEQVLDMMARRRSDADRVAVWRNAASTVFARDGACVYCGSTDELTVDHILPKKLGGDSDPLNLAAACKSCNSSKRHRTPESARMTFINAEAARRWEQYKEKQGLIQNVRLDSMRSRAESIRSTTPEPEPEPVKEIPVAIATGGIDAADAASDPEPTDPPDGLPDCPAQKLVDLYHAKLPALPQCLVLTKTRRGYLRARWREYAEQNEWKTEADGLEFFADYFAHVARSKFLTGRASGRDGRPPFVADLEWLFRPTNFAKVVEGKYHA